MEFEEETHELSCSERSYTGRILETTKRGFFLGMFCGLFSHPVKGIRNLPKNGLKPLLKAWPQAALTNVPRFGGKFAAFTAVWSSLNYATNHYHWKKYGDYAVPRECYVLDNIISLTATVALFKSPQGFRVASRSAIGWGSVYSIFRGCYEVLDIFAERASAAEEFRVAKMNNEIFWENYRGRMLVEGLAAQSTSSNKEASKEDEEALEGLSGQATSSNKEALEEE